MSALVRAFIADLDEEAVNELIAVLTPGIVARVSAQPEPWMTVEQAATYLGCKAQRIHNLTSQGRLRFAKDGSRKLFRREWLDGLLDGATA